VGEASSIEASDDLLGSSLAVSAVFVSTLAWSDSLSSNLALVSSHSHGAFACRSEYWWWNVDLALSVGSADSINASDDGVNSSAVGTVSILAFAWLDNLSVDLALVSSHFQGADAFASAVWWWNVNSASSV